MVPTPTAAEVLSAAAPPLHPGTVEIAPLGAVPPGSPLQVWKDRGSPSQALLGLCKVALGANAHFALDVEPSACTVYSKRTPLAHPCDPMESASVFLTITLGEPPLSLLPPQ